MGFVLKMVAAPFLLLAGVALVFMALALMSGYEQARRSGPDLAWAQGVICVEIERRGAKDCGIPQLAGPKNGRMRFAGTATQASGERVAYAGEVAVLCEGARAACYPLRRLRIGNRTVLD